MKSTMQVLSDYRDALMVEVGQVDDLLKRANEFEPLSVASNGRRRRTADRARATTKQAAAKPNGIGVREAIRLTLSALPGIPAPTLINKVEKNKRLNTTSLHPRKNIDTTVRQMISQNEIIRQRSGKLFLPEQKRVSKAA
jgi:hypothetical protein